MSTRVLIVDDNDDNLRIMRGILTGQGFEVRTAVDGPSALELIEQARPDVILLDVMMPEMDGLEVLDRLKAAKQLLYGIGLVLGMESA
jgi:CheY-like chemotaxis protein